MEKFEQLSDWIIIDDYCATRIVLGGDPEKVEDRVAFIEKTPRVRLSKYKFGLEDSKIGGCFGQDKDAWLSGPKGNDEYGRNEDSRKWCDDMLKLLGWM